MIIVVVKPRISVAVTPGSVLTMPMTFVPVMLVLAMLPLLVLRLAITIPHHFLELPPLHRIIHDRLIRRLLLFLDRQHWIISDLCRGVPCRIGILQCHKAFLTARLLHLFRLPVLQQSVQPSPSQQVPLHFLSCAGLAIRRTAVHPVDAVLPARATGRLAHLLQLLDLPLLGALFEDLRGLLALFKGLLLFLPDLALVRHEHRMP